MPAQDNKDNFLQIDAASFIQKLNINREQKCKEPIIKLKLINFIYTKLATFTSRKICAQLSLQQLFFISATAAFAPVCRSRGASRAGREYIRFMYGQTYVPALRATTKGRP